MAAGARRKKRKKYLKLRKNRGWVYILLLFLVLGIGVGVILLFLELFVTFSVQSQVSSGYDNVRYLAAIIDNGITDDDDVYDLMEAEGWSFTLLDKNGGVLRQNGQDTYDKPGRVVEIMCSERDFGNTQTLAEYSSDEEYFDNLVRKVTVYTDTQKPYLLPDDEDGVVVNFDAVIKDYRSGNITSLAKGENTDSSDTDIINTVKTIELPLWVSVDINDGSQQLIAKISVAARISDIAIIAVMIAALFAVIVLLLLVVILYAISMTIEQRRVMRLFFRDIATSGNNWMWFLLKGENLLRKRKWARTNFAVVDMTFVKYHTFCVCHSIEEGENLLAKVYNGIGEQLDKKELYAHCGDGAFALLMRYSDEKQLEDRLRTLIRHIEGVDDRYNIFFQAGIFPVETVEDASRLFARRKDVDLERDHSNARTARSKLEGSEGSGIVFFDEGLVEEQKWAETVQEKQQAALDNEEFLVYYQPKYDPSTDRLKGAEALIRWDSPEFGLVSPFKFIPIFEKNGFITEIDHYMITHAARDQRRWLDMGLRCVPVSVNISRSHFVESDLAEQIRDLVDKEGTPHEYIEIELTESAFFDDKKAMVDTIQRLKEYGFAVSMDDFGSGYSSLNSLKDMPLDVLKLDAEFFRGEAADTSRAEIVVAEAIKLAKSLNMRTVAEGVEVREQVEFLAEKGCDMIQGYYYAKPMPGTEFEDRMRANI